jgi:hypothetical protein
MTTPAITTANGFNRAAQTVRGPIVSSHVARFVAAFVRGLAALKPVGESQKSRHDVYIGL